MHSRRALLYMPGDDWKKITKATTLGVDCICMDMGDGVVNKKAEAREAMAKALRELDFGKSEKLARINASVREWRSMTSKPSCRISRWNCNSKNRIARTNSQLQLRAQGRERVLWSGYVPGTGLPGSGQGRSRAQCLLPVPGSRLLGQRPAGLTGRGSRPGSRPS